LLFINKFQTLKRVKLIPEVGNQQSGDWEAPEVMATVGPTLERPDDLRLAIEAGARWFRLPCGYRQRPHIQNSRAIREAALEQRTPVRLLLDLPSSRPRTGSMQELRLQAGERVIFWDPEITPRDPGRNGFPHVPLPGLAELLSKLRPRHRMWFCDGRLRFVVDEVQVTSVLARVQQGTIPLKASNSIFLPDSPSPFTVVTPQDGSLLDAFAAEKLVPDWVALSLISSPEDVRAGRREVRRRVGGDVRIMSKLETLAAVECAEDIINAADGIMVARGDLGLAIGYVRLPEVQERLVGAARQAHKPVVVATQVLEMFAETGLPQRAELSDLSLIARQRAHAVMLGKETVFSPRPIECIRLAREVLAYETQRFERLSRTSREECQPLGDFAAVHLAHGLPATINT
jgi:pyruvate kinase